MFDESTDINIIEFKCLSFSIWYAINLYCSYN